MREILTVNNKTDEKFLRLKTAEFDFSKFTRKEINELVKMMREIMIKTDGIGLAANQIGLDFRLFVAQLPKSEKTGDKKFYAIFNPEIVKTSGDKELLDEGCLSVPGGYYGEVDRDLKITLEGFDKNNKKLKIKAWGLLARVFQHEIDHLNGKLFIDKAKSIKKIELDKKVKI